MKIVDVVASFPDVIIDGYALEITKKGEASTFKAAISRTIGLVLKDPSLKRKRIKSVNFSVVVEE